MPAYVLIHGGGTTGRFWDRLVPHLDGPVLAVDLPGRAGRPADLASLTVAKEVDSVVADIHDAQLDVPIVLVAHSSGGLVVPGVLEALGGAVSRVVLNAASVPPEGGCGLDCMQGRHRDGIMAAVEMTNDEGRPLLTPGPPSDPEAFRTAYGPPLNDDDLAFVVDPVRCVVDTMSHYFQPISWEAAPPTPVTYLVNLKDRPVPVDLQREMAARLPRPPTIIELDTGHIPAIVEPAMVAAHVNER
ncbi:MAG TPA: alpha/beta hydrolase [Acidimicrobiales bacterium]|nr:alpha/beta hydrolase [Acidimicrobiales bacterium]